MMYDEFMEIVENGWGTQLNQSDKAKRLGAKLKHHRKVLRLWQQQLSNLANTIDNTKSIIMLLDIMEEFRDLSMEE
jgi:hypothetical protein